MLQQILRDMWVDPELLAELDDSQKQTLFCKMREEQVRRWKVWDASHPTTVTDSTTNLQHHNTTPRPLNINNINNNNNNNNNNLNSGKKKKVGFLVGSDGEPWVWVMGEHEEDKTIEQILEEEAREVARIQAQKETMQFRISVEAEWDKYLEENRKNIEEMEIGQSSQPEDIYCSADELKQMVVLPKSVPHPKRDALQEISFNKPHKVLQRVAQWEKRVMEEKTSEIFKRIQKKKQEAVKEAEEAESKQEQLWREQQKKAKEAELQIREIARRAREEHRRSVQDMNVPPKPQPPQTIANKAEQNFGCSKPPSKDAIVEWFRTSQIGRRAGLEPNSNVIAPWFHGLITRHEAEALLSNQPVGSFLVRLSERIWGYAISYRDTDRCKHYLVDASNGHYQFLGTNQISHNTLGDLVNYHGASPITAVGGELLGHPCHRSEPLPPLFRTLFIRAR